MAGFQQFLNYAFTMPTAVFTVLLCLVILYWLVSLLGLFHLEMFDAAEGLAHGAEGLAHGAEGLAHGAEGLAHGAEGLAHGAAEGLAHGAADGLLDGAEGAAHAAGESAGVGHHIGFGDVPRTMTWSLVIFFGWVFSLACTVYLPRFTEVAMRGLTIVTVAVGIVSLTLGVLATAVAIQPLRKALLAGYGTMRSDLVGRICIVKTLRVDEDFGQAELDDGSSVIQVRNPQKYPFQSHQRALIYDYDSAREVFYIVPAEDES